MVWRAALSLRRALAQQVRVATSRYVLVGPLARMELVATWRSRPATMFLCEVVWVLMAVAALCDWSVAVLTQAPVAVLLLLRATATLTVVR